MVQHFKTSRDVCNRLTLKILSETNNSIQSILIQPCIWQIVPTDITIFSFYIQVTQVILCPTIILYKQIYSHLACIHDKKQTGMFRILTLNFTQTCMHIFNFYNSELLWQKRASVTQRVAWKYCTSLYQQIFYKKTGVFSLSNFINTLSLNIHA